MRDGSELILTVFDVAHFSATTAYVVTIWFWLIIESGVIHFSLLNTLDHMTKVKINKMNHNNDHKISFILFLFFIVINLYTFTISIHNDMMNSNPKNIIQNVWVRSIAVEAGIIPLKLFGFLRTRKKISAKIPISKINIEQHHIAIHLNDNFLVFHPFLIATFVLVWISLSQSIVVVKVARVSLFCLYKSVSFWICSSNSCFWSSVRSLWLYSSFNSLYFSCICSNAAFALDLSKPNFEASMTASSMDGFL